MDTVLAGKYRVLKKLGEGGFGVVYLVEHPDLQVNYAVKVMNQNLSQQDHIVSALKREAETLLKFSHPGCVQLRDFGRLSTGEYYLATDFCEGVSLASRLDEVGRMSCATVLDIVRQILSVLEAVHERGIIHRDIKPENIILQRQSDGSDHITILDFGVALPTYDPNSNQDVSVTSGTPAYMAPEQILGERDIDGRADLYSVGVIAYELLTGVNPFESATVMDTLIKQVTAPAPPFHPALNIPENVSKIIFRALEKKSRNRFQQVREFRNACSTLIADLAPDEPSLPMSPPPPVITGFSSHATNSQPTIVCLDDDQGFLNIFSFLLQREGFRVITVSSYESLYHPLSDPSVRLLITDVQMPDIPGSKVCKLIKNARPDIAILLLSGMPEDELIRLVSESNADGFLSKGTQPTRWIPRIRQIVGN